ARFLRRCLHRELPSGPEQGKHRPRRVALAGGSGRSLRALLPAPALLPAAPDEGGRLRGGALRVGASQGMIATLRAAGCAAYERYATCSSLCGERATSARHAHVVLQTTDGLLGLRAVGVREALDADRALWVAISVHAGAVGARHAAGLAAILRHVAGVLWCGAIFLREALDAATVLLTAVG